MNKWLLIFLTCGAVVRPLTAEAAGEPITKGELLKTFYKANNYRDAGNDSMAIVTLEGLAMRVPRLPITYLRMAEIYDRMAEKNEADVAALNGAVLMYRKYLSLELNETKTEPVSTRLRVLEDKMKIAHFEEEDKKAGEEQLNLANAIPVVETDEETERIAVATTAMKANLIEGLQNVKPELNLSEIPATVDVSVLPDVRNEEPSAPVVNDYVPEALANQSCDRLPDLGAVNISRLKLYDIEHAVGDYTPKACEGTLSPEILEGHWVSSITTPSGRESWIFDIVPFGDSYSIALHRESGVVNKEPEKQNFYNKIIGLLEENEFLSNTTQTIVCDQVEGVVHDKTLSFTFESEKDYKPSTGIYTWGHTLLENLSSVIPFGNIIYKLGDSFLNKRTEKDVEAIFTIESRFNCSLVADGVLECRYAMKEKKTAKGKGTKIVNSALSRFYFYKTGEDYVCFTPMDLESADMNYLPLFEKVSHDAVETVEMNYPLALLYLYGIGTERSEVRAVELMTQLAKEKNCGRAMAWLSTFYFNLAYNNKEEVSTSLRKKYLKTSNYWLGKMRGEQMPAWYALKADMNESCNETDSVLQFYKTGALKGDPYASYKMAVCALKGRYMKQKNPVMAQKYLTEACRHNYPDAYLQVALMYKDGIGYPCDTAAYVQNLLKAVDMGSVAALGELSEAYIRGIGVERSFNKANLMREYRRNAENTEWMDILTLYGYDVEAYR